MEEAKNKKVRFDASRRRLINPLCGNEASEFVSSPTAARGRFPGGDKTGKIQINSRDSKMAAIQIQSSVLWNRKMVEFSAVLRFTAALMVVASPLNRRLIFPLQIRAFRWWESIKSWIVSGGGCFKCDQSWLGRLLLFA